MLTLKSSLIRLLSKPGYTLVVVLTLGAGIAANSFIFSSINAILLSDSDLPNAEDLVIISQTSDSFELPHGLSYLDFRDIREQSEELEKFALYMPNAAHLSVRGTAPKRTWLELVTPSLFADYGVKAALGRTLLPSDGEDYSGEKVVFLSHDAWVNQFSADPNIVGRSVQLNGKPFTVVGVAEEGFYSVTFSMNMAGWVPTSAVVDFNQTDTLLRERSAFGWNVLATVAQGSSVELAQKELSAFADRFANLYPESHSNVGLRVTPENKARPVPAFADFMPILTFLFSGLVGLVLLIACANVANLMLAQAAKRETEITLRAVVGATRKRLIFQLLVESLLLAILAGAIGWLLSYLVGFVIQGVSSTGDVPIRQEVTMSWKDLVFTILISLFAGVLAGLVPALRASRVNVAESLKRNASNRSTRGSHWLRNTLVVCQITFSLVVLVGGGLFLKSLERAKGMDLGFEPEGVLVTSFDLGLQGYSESEAYTFYEQLLDKTRELPGVESAALTDNVPFGYSINIAEARPENPPAQLEQGKLPSKFARVSEDYLSTMKVRLEAGRFIQKTDTADTPLVAVVNRAFADISWPGEDPIGKRFRQWNDESPMIEVVGVVTTGKFTMISDDQAPFFFLPLRQQFDSTMSLLVRSEDEPLTLIPRIRQALRELDSDLPVYDQQSLVGIMNSSFFGFLALRIGATLASIQGGIALLLSVLGLYSIVAYNVTQRTSEICIRMAIGANATSVLRFIGREAATLTLVGLVLGSIVAIALNFALAQVLYDTPAIDIPVFAIVLALLIGTSFLASYFPARRVTRLDPLAGLRAQ